MGLTWEEVEASAQDRQTWRQHVALCISDAGWIKSRQVYCTAHGAVACLLLHRTLVRLMKLSQHMTTRTRPSWQNYEREVEHGLPRPEKVSVMSMSTFFITNHF